MARIFPLLLAGMLLSVLLAGCIEDLGGGDVAFTVVSADLEEGHCTWGMREGGYGPEWCHIIVVEARNDHPHADADVSSTAWEADGTDRQTYGFPRVEGEGNLPAGDTAIVALRFDAPEATRLTTLHHATLYSETTSRTIPDY